MSKKRKNRSNNPKNVQELEQMRQDIAASFTAYNPRPVPRPQIPQVTLTLSGDDFIATDHTGHAIRLPANENGARVLKHMLRAKQLSPQKQLGSAAQPTQQMVEAFLKNRRLEEENEQAAILREF